MSIERKVEKTRSSFRSERSHGASKGALGDVLILVSIDIGRLTALPIPTG